MDILTFIIGVILLFKGNTKFSSTRVITSSGMMILAFSLMAPAIINFISGATGLWTSDATDVYRGYITYGQMLFVIMIVGFFFTKKSEVVIK